MEEKMNIERGAAIVCFIWGLLMFALGSMAFGDIGLSFGTQGIFAFIIGIVFWYKSKKPK